MYLLSPCLARDCRGSGSRSASLRADYPRLGILHTPPCFIPRCVLVAIPRGPADVKIGIRRSSKHDPRARISHRGWEAAMLRIKRPKHHPVWPYGNWRACLIEGRVVAMLRGAAEHVTQSRCTVRRCGFSGSGVPEPLHPEFIDAHRGISNPVFVTGSADPAIVALTEDSHRTAMVHLSNRSIASDHRGPRAQRSSDLYSLLQVIFRRRNGHLLG